MILSILQSIGLDELEAKIYLQLLQNKVNRVSTIANQLKLPRSTVQSGLQRLENEELVTKVFEKNTAIFSPIPPEEITDLIELRRKREDKKYQELKQQFEKVIPELQGLMQINDNLPSIKFYKGKEGVRKVLFDTLTSKTELKGFINVDAMDDQVLDINKEYVAARERSNIKKRALILDSPHARKDRESGKYSPKSYIAWKWIDKNLYPFSIEMNIYDGKISYLTYVKNSLTAVIIKNDHIYEMHKSIWQMLWDSLPEGGRSKYCPKNYQGD